MTNVIDVSAETFQNQVMETSTQKLVLLDFWATWCNPCKQLVPILVKLANEYDGQFVLAKVDIDQNKELAEHFAVRSVPTVKFIRNGQIVDEFSGVLSEAEIKGKLSNYIERESDALYQQAMQDLQNGDNGAIAKMQEICLNDPDNHKISIHFASILAQTQQFETAKAFIDALPKVVQDKDEVKSITAQINIAESAQDLPDPETLMKTLEKNPGDLQARFQFSQHLVLQGDVAAAMDQLLEIIKRDRTFEDDLGRKELLKLFDIVGTQGEQGAKIVSEYRRKLARYLN